MINLNFVKNVNDFLMIIIHLTYINAKQNKVSAEKNIY